jgi:hypothetical protein
MRAETPQRKQLYVPVPFPLRRACGDRLKVSLREEHGSIVVIYRRDADGWHMRLVEPSVPESADQ